MTSMFIILRNPSGWFRIITGTAMILSFSSLLKAQPILVSSPDGQLNVQIQLQNDGNRTGSLFYQVNYQGKSVLEESSLDIQLYEGWSLAEDLEILGQQISNKDTTWQPVYGERDNIRDNYQQLRLTLRNKSRNRKFNLLIRAYNEGMALAYEFPEEFGYGILEIAGENTHFRFPEGTKAWHTPRAQSEYQLLPLQNWNSESERPVTLELPNGIVAAIGEAMMVNYARMRLDLSTAYPQSLVSSLAGKVVESSPFQTPWRVVMVADDAGKLIENNDIFLNLNPPNQLENTWWIRPGKAIREVTLSTKGAKACVDFAVEQGLDFIHFDAGWYGFEYTVDSDPRTVTVDPRRNPKGDLDLQEAIRYAKSKGIGVWVYVNRRALERHLDEILPLYKSWGIDGIKFGFVQLGTHRWTTWLHDAVKKAGEHQLMVNIHDEYRPTGFSRTYPNLMTQEGVFGNEEMPEATHNTILPYTRFLCGPADYTIAYYYRKEFGHENKFIKTTPAHQLALSVIYYSPVQWMYWYDRPADYQGEPETEFFAKVPTVWDETRFLSGKIGESALLARRKGSEWFVGGITNNDSRELDLSLDFLDPDKTYRAIQYTDGGAEIKTRTRVKIEEKIVGSKDRLKYKLKPSGGVALILVENKK